MRLTLRTLLAYLDDRLSPANAREIGQKIKESPFATDLTARAKDVVRRRRLASQPSSGKQLDANLIAEYLDDQLTPELVALIEKEILASDSTLAEVAATHQILGLLSDPVDIGEPLRERILKLGPQVESTEVVEAEEGGTPEWKPMQPQSTGRRSPILLLAVMVLGWLVLVATDSDLFGSGNANAVAGNINQPPDEVPEPLPNNDAAEEAPDDSKESDAASPKIAAVESPATTTNPAGPLNGGPAVPPNSTDGNPNPDSMVAVSPDVGPPTTTPPVEPVSTPPTPAPETTTDAPNMAATENTTPAPENKAAAAPEPTSPGAVLNMRDDFRTVLLGDPETDSWSWADSAGVVDWTAELQTSIAGVAAPFHAELSLNDGWSVRALGNSLWRMTADNPHPELMEGRFLLQNSEADAMPLPISVDGRIFHFTPPPAGKRIAIQVTPLVNPDAPVDPKRVLPLIPLNQSCVLQVLAVDSPATMKLDETELQIPSGNWVELLASATDIAPPQPGMIPEWVFESDRDITEAVKETHTEIAKLLRTGEAPADGISPLIDHRNSQMGTAAVNVLVLIRDVKTLNQLLLNSETSEVGQDATSGLQAIFHQSQGGAEAIQADLETRLASTQIADFMKLIAGFQLVEAEDRVTSEWLVSQLSSRRIAIRELAIFNLQQLTGETNGFSASDSSSRREAAANRWRKLLARNDGRLVKPSSLPSP